MHNIRWRIGVSVFLLAATLQLIAAVFVLGRVERVQRGEVDLLLNEELAEVEALLGTPQLAQLIRSEEEHNTKWNELFFEVRDPSGGLVVASSNVPAEGLGAPNGSESVISRAGHTYRVWERMHPATRKGHRRIRVAELWFDDGSAVRVGRGMKRYQRTVWRLRSQMAWGLLVVSVLGALGAWLVASRALLPIQAIAAEARSLGASLAGEIPRTGSGDELDQLALVLNDMLGRIRSEVRRVRRVTADVAHGLRTPLTALRGELELQLHASPESAARLGALLEMLDEMVVLVNRLLLLERLESSSAEDMPPAERLELDRIVREVVDGMSVVSQEQKQELVCKTEPVAVSGDAAALRNALLNLIDNAQRHTPEGGRIDVRVRPVEDWAQLEVEDSGPGLRPDQIERVFERFYSEREGPPGSGLGLAIARAVAEAHGGTLVASSPAGALFALRIPRVG